MLITFPLLTVTTFLPLVGGLLALLPWRNQETVRWVSLLAVFMDLLFSLGIFVYLAAGPLQPGGWIIREEYAWIDVLGIRYSLAVDGISLLLVLLMTFVGVMSVLISWKEIQHHVGSFHFFLLAAQTGIIGVFLATDLFLFYLFWEIQIIPLFFLIGIWGHKKELRVKAAVKYFLFSITGSLLMLLAIIGLYLLHGAYTGHYTFALSELLNTPMDPTAEMALYVAFLTAFAVKIPLFPVHTWLPDAHTEAPTAGSVDLAGLMLKTGTYALLRFAIPLFPEAAKKSVPMLLALGLAAVFYAAWIALVQKDMKRLVAYTSIGHMGLIVIALAVWNHITLAGAVLLMVNHGLSTSALFILIGMIAERTGSREFSDVRGLWKQMPVLSGFFLFFAMATAGMPGLNNFVSEMLIIFGTFRPQPVVAAIAFAGLVFVIIYAVRLVQDAVYLEPKTYPAMWDVTGREAVVLIPLAVVTIFLGFYPGPALALLEAPVRVLMEQAGGVMSGGQLTAIGY